jgi:hypothetical protein
MSSKKNVRRGYKPFRTQCVHWRVPVRQILTDTGLYADAQHAKVTARAEFLTQHGFLPQEVTVRPVNS